MRISPWLTACLVAVAVSDSAVCPAAAQNKFAQPSLVAQTAPSAVPQLPLPPADKIVLLIRMALLTLNDAIESGNYTVLRDRGGPSFRQANTESGLARIFSTLEAQRPDLAVVAIMTPQLSEAAVVGLEQRLHLKGHFPSQPQQINFELVFEPSEGRWQLFGLAVSAVPAQVQAAPTPPPGPAKPAADAAPKAAASKPAQPKPPAAKK
jgi:hypothetical protein